MIVAPLLAACAAPHVKETADKMVGHNIREAVAKLGDPIARRDIPPLTIYTWETRRTVSFVIPERTAPAGPGRGAPVIGSVTPFKAIAECRLEITVDPESHIKNFRFDGNSSGCAWFARVLGE